MRLVVFGAGYVGLVTGTGLSDLGHDVLVYDIDPDKIAQAQRRAASRSTSPASPTSFTATSAAGASRSPARSPPSFDDADAYFIAVGTPPGPDGAADLSAVMAVADTIAKRREEAGARRREEHRPGRHVRRGAGAPRATRRSPLEVVSNPEFLKEGDAVSDFFKPDRVVVGARSEDARQLLRELYAPLQLSGERLVVTDPRSSELIKYASNTMLAIRISFMNELSRLCHATGADIHSVRLGVGTDSRIGKKFLYAGPGYGGSCFPKDVQALAALGREHGVQMRVAEAAHAANEEQAIVPRAARREGARRRQGQADRALGLRLQARDRRHPRVARREARHRAARARRHRRRARSRGGAELREALRQQSSS